MTRSETTGLVTRDTFEGTWDALWQGWYTNPENGQFTIQIERLGKGPHVLVELMDGSIRVLREVFGPGFDENAGGLVMLKGVLRIDGRVKQDGSEWFDMVALRPKAAGPFLLQAIGEDVRLEIRDADWVACRQKLGIGRALESSE